MADYFIDEYAPSRSGRNNLRAFEGFILSGPEYLTVFDGATGRVLTRATLPGSAAAPPDAASRSSRRMRPIIRELSRTRQAVSAFGASPP